MSRTRSSAQFGSLSIHTYIHTYIHIYIYIYIYTYLYLHYEYYCYIIVFYFVIIITINPNACPFRQHGPTLLQLQAREARAEAWSQETKSSCRANSRKSGPCSGIHVLRVAAAARLICDLRT